jgi:hypothetical protein
MDDRTAAIISKKSPAERLAIAHDMWRFARDKERTLVARQNPNWTTAQVDREVATRTIEGRVERSNEEYYAAHPLTS